MLAKSVSFAKGVKADYIRTLRKRVGEYFEENHISKYGNWRMAVKTIAMLSFLLVPYLTLLFAGITNGWIVALLYAAIGVGQAGVGFSVMHDACHGSFSKYPWLNKIFSYTMNFVGGNASLWKIQHNVLHHSFTNVEGLDEDIAPPAWLLRFSPHAKRYWIHRLQHIYGWGFYALGTLSWATTKDFTGLFKYKRDGLLNKKDGPFSFLLTKVILWKVVYYAYILVLPLILVPVSWWVVLIGFLVMHLVAGLLVGIVFQTAHVMPQTQFPVPSEDGTLENNWAVHQVLTTMNFAPKSHIFAWYIGGLNFQIEHHLFPNICHIHYKKISKIVKETTLEFGLPYQSKQYFLGALWEHAKMLRSLGRPAVQAS